MQRVFAIAGLTWKAAFRFRLFLTLAALLLGAVVVLPLLIKDDATARGFIQIMLTYTLSVITALLGLATLWLACGTLARDIEECQMQVVAVKPIPRWQIWLGKWLGILSLNAVLLALAGGCVYGLLLWRAQRLPPEQQQVLRNEVLVARASLKEPAPDVEADVERILQERLKQSPVTGVDLDLVRRQIREQVKAAQQIVPPGYGHRWKIDLGSVKDFLRDQPLYLRVKFYAAQSSASGTFLAFWQVGSPEAGRVWRPREVKSLAPDTFYEFAIPPNLFDANGRLIIEFQNRNETTLLFPLEDGMEVLYREGGFGLNYARGLCIILCWLALLAALGLAAASCLSFPVAAFVSCAALVMALSSGVMSRAVSEGTVMSTDHETGGPAASWFNAAVLPLFRALLKVINLVEAFSPINSLNAGRSITWGQLTLAFSQIVLFLGGMIGWLGIFLFERRELATVQGTS